MQSDVSTRARDRATERPILWEPALSFLQFATAAMTLGAGGYLLALLVTVPEQHWRPFLALAFMGIAGLAWWHLRRRRVSAAMWTMAVGVWIYATVTSYVLGGPLGPATVIYPLPILLIGWLVGTRAAFITAAATSATVLVFVVLDAVGLLPVPPATPPVLRWIIQSGVWILTAALISSIEHSYQERLIDVRVLHADLHRAQAVAHVGSWVYELATDRLLLSAETCRIFGVPEGTVGTHDSYLARVHPDDRLRVANAWQAALAGGPAFDDEHRILLGGETRWVRQLAELERDAAGRPTRSVGTTQDITARRHTEETLRLARIGVEQVSEAIFWSRSDGRFADVNAAACASLGYTREELLTLSVADIDPNMTPERWPGRVAEIRALGSVRFQTLHRRKDGQTFPVEILTSHVRIGSEDRLCAFSRDISEQLQREAELQTAKQQLQATLDAIPDLLFEVDLNGRYLSWHSPRRDLLAAPPEQFLGRLIAEVMPRSVADICMAAIQEADATGRSQGRQFMLDLPQGTSWFELSVSRKTPGADGLPRFIVLSRDITPRKRVEEALRAEEAQLECILGSTADGILAVDRAGRVIRANQRFRDMWRLPAAIVEARDDRAMLDYVANQLVDADGFRETVAQLYASEQTLTDTIQFVDGRSFERYTAPMRENGVVVGRVWSFRDVSDRLRDQQRLTVAAEATNTVFWDLDFETGQFRFDHERLERLGVDLSTPVVRFPDWVARIHPEDRAGFVALVEASMPAQASAFDLEYRVRAAAGGYVWVHTRAGTVRRDRNGMTTMAVGTVMNTTIRKEAEIALRERDGRLAAVFNGSPLPGVVSRVESGEVLETNDAALRWFGAERSEVVGRSVNALGLYARPEQREAMVAQLRTQGSADAFPLELRVKSGEIRATEMFGRVVMINGEACLVAMLLDVTERNRAEDRQRQAQKLESLGTLAGGIAHDFNNILGAIRGNADLAVQDLPAGHPAAQEIEAIRTAVSRATDLVRRIMLFATPKEPRHEVVDLTHVVDEVLRLLRSTLPAGIRLRTDFAQEAPRVRADAGQVHEAVVNLTTNAAQAIGDGAGDISYRIEPVEVASASAVVGLAPGRYVRLIVADTGHGIAPGQIDRIFDAFYTTKPVGEGSGLGLSMVHGIMKSHGGAVVVESTTGSGATFSLYFPVADDDEYRTHAAMDAPVPPTGRRVLFIDDEPALVATAERSLPRHGHECTCFRDPKKAVAFFSEHAHDIDVVVTDLSMPGLSGFEVARALLAVRPDIPIIMTTGWVRGQDERLARDIGIRELILKPIGMGDLSQVIERILREQ